MSCQFTACVTRGWAGRDKPFWRNQLQATPTAQKRGDSHPSGARCVGRSYVFEDLMLLRNFSNLSVVLKTFDGVKARISAITNSVNRTKRTASS